MVGEKLHDYDLCLCDYALGNVQQYMDDPQFTALVEESLPGDPLLDYLKAEMVDPMAEHPQLLLNDHDLEGLALCVWSDEPRLCRDWLPYESLHERHIYTLREVRGELSTQAAEDWSSACGRFGEQLTREGLDLKEGIEIVQDWVCCLRKYLRAMGAHALLPCPEGQSPTPRCKTPASPAAHATELSTQGEAAALQAMRAAIAEHGQNAPPKQLIKLAGIRVTTARNALRKLEKLGEYDGFARRRPRRYSEKTAR